MQIIESISEPKLVDLLKSGNVGVLPTDTVYGLVACATNIDAVMRLYALKHRERKPGTLIAANLEQLMELGLNKRSLRAVADYWPASLSVVIPCSSPELEYLTQGLGSLASRIPADEALRRLLEQTGPLITSSANNPGEAPANNLTEAENYFGEEVDFYVDGGDLSGRSASTVIRIVDDAIEVLRQGSVKVSAQ